MAEDKKYYWLKLKKDFFKRHDIRIVKAMPNGKDYILFYLTLLVESVDHEGYLRFSETIPYNEEMLATITDTNIDIVRSAMKVFTELKMIEVLEDCTIYMAEVNRMLGGESYWAERKRITRSIGQCPDNVPALSNMSKQEIDIDIDIEKDIDIENKADKPPKPTRHKNGVYQHVLLTDDETKRLREEYGDARTVEYIRKVDEYIQKSGKKYKDFNLVIREWLNRDHVKPKDAEPQDDFETRSLQRAVKL